MFSLMFEVPISDFDKPSIGYQVKVKLRIQRKPWVQLLEQVTKEASWRVVVFAESRHMAIGLPDKYVNHHINLTGFTKRSMSKPWWTPTIVSAWDSALVRWNDTSDSACPKRNWCNIYHRGKVTRFSRHELQCQAPKDWAWLHNT